MKPPFNKTAAIAFIVISLTGLFAQAQESSLELGILKEGLSNRTAKLDEPLISFQTNYAERLVSLKKEAQKAGDLDQILAIDNEIKLIPSGGSDVPGNFTDLVAARKIYDDHVAKLSEQRAGKLRSLLRAHRSKLSALQTKLTKDGQIAQAIEVKREIASVDARLGSNLATSSLRGLPMTTAGSSSPGKLVIFGTYSDGSAAELTERQKGEDFIQVAAGHNHWMALTDAGKVSPRLGANEDHLPPTGTSNVIDIQCGRHLHFALKADGEVVGLGEENHTRLIPEVEKGRVAKISAGQNKNAFLLKDGTMIPFGWELRDIERFSRDDLISEVADVSAGGAKIGVIKKDGNAHLVRISGSESTGKPDDLNDVVAVEAGLSSGAYFLDKRGGVIAWRAPEPPSDLKRAIQLRVGETLAAAQMEDGTWVLWGAPSALAVSMNEKLKELGPLKDLAIGTKFFVGIK